MAGRSTTAFNFPARSRSESDLHRLRLESGNSPREQSSNEQVEKRLEKAVNQLQDCINQFIHVTRYGGTRPYSRRPRLCYRCRSTGHLVRDCPQQKNANLNPRGRSGDQRSSHTTVTKVATWLLHISSDSRFWCRTFNIQWILKYTFSMQIFSLSTQQCRWTK